MTSRLVAGALGLLVFAGLSVYGWQGVVRLREVRGHLETLERENTTLRVQAERLTRTIDQLRNDPAYLERLAREEQGMVRPGETILKFPPKDAASR